ncbi:uncharacterized protein FTOL_04494 [Fusarium torulosum]|uniref:HAT C-terminal dimerisation domain-containing protein n=1 Tax=Fusarium torulosum TaxID=33205 RepID=A0AAE8M5V0_9HYPO|nr:uncharacterized protein FTOL_04494 [Fusarium torulosum]
MAHEEACNAVSASGSNTALDYIERRLAFSRSLVRPDSQERQSKRPKQSVALPVQDELDQYLSEPPVDNIAYKLDPIAWWRDVGAVRFPQLSYMAVDFLTIASSSAETERDFSSCGRMVTPLRCRLRRHIVAMAQCLRSWSKAGIYQPTLPLGLLEVVDSTVRILVILPDDWEFVRQSTLSTHNTHMPTSSNPVNESPTPPRPAGPGGVASRNPFSSPIRGQKQSPQMKAASPTLPSKQSDCEATKPPACPREKHTPLTPTTIDVNPVLPIPSSDSDCTEGGSDTKQMLDDQLDPTSPTPTRKRKQQSTPEPIRSKRTTAGKRRAQLYD